LSEAQGGGAETGESPQQAGAGEDRASALRVVTVAALLLLLAAAGGLLVRPWETTFQPEAFLSEVFAGVDEPLAGGLVLEEARRLPTGERFVRYGPAEGPGGATSSGAVELTIVEIPASRGEEVLKEQLSGLRFESEGMESGGGRPGSRGGRGGWGEKKRASKLREKGTFTWHGYDADFARLWHKGTASGASEREPGSEPAQAQGGEGAGGTAGSYETIRVNLSTGGRCLLAYIRFEEGLGATEEEAAAIVSSFRPLD